MNLVGGYDSTDDDEEPQQQPQHRPQHVEEGTPPGEGKALPSTSTGTAPAQASTKQVQQPAEDASSKGKKRKDRKKGTAKKKKKKKSKTVNALVLSPEIQAALARGDTLGDSDSDDQDAHKKPPKFVRRPAGSDPNDLLSLLPQPSTATSADDILLKNKKRRQDANKAKSRAAVLASPSGVAAANGGGGSVGGSAAADRGMATPTASKTWAGEGGGSREGKGVASQASDSDDDGDHLLSGVDSKSVANAAAGAGAGAAAGGARPDESTAGGPLFTLPSRSRPPAGAAATGFQLFGEAMEGSDTVVPQGIDAAQQQVEQEGQEKSLGQQRSAAGFGYAAGFAPPAWQSGTGHGGAVGATVVGTGAGATASQHAAHVTASFQMRQHQQAPYYPPAAAQASAGFGDPTPQRAGGHEAEFGGGGGKSTRRKGRDMERALARGDLAALGSETPVMDLHQGSNDYNPLRTKPVTAAMKQDQKHIEGSVYDPSTGQTVKTLEPTSTQKRKHQINQLAVQAASMERDLMERSGASRLTKAQTHAKYGW